MSVPIVFGKLRKPRRPASPKPTSSYGRRPYSLHYGREEFERDVKDLQRRFASMRIGIDL